MSGELELVSDGNGLTVLGNPDDIDRFFLSAGINAESAKDLDLTKFSSFAGTGGAIGQIGANFAENSGRWVKLTKESAEAVSKHGLMASKTPGVSHAMIGQPGDIKQWIQIAQAPSALLAGPFALTALSTMMQQQAMQQQMDQIVEYLQEINEKVDDVLRNQKDSVLSQMIGVDLTLEGALTVRDQVGRVSDTTWSKVQGSEQILASTQSYAIRQLDAISQKLQSKTDLGDIAKATKDAEPKIREWLAVLAHTFRLLDAFSVLELDHVFEEKPEELELHRQGLISARQKRIDVISRKTNELLLEMDENIKAANTKVLLNPFDSPAVVTSSNKVTSEVVHFRRCLEIESEHDSKDARRWREAAGEFGDKAVSTTVEGATIAAEKAEEALKTTNAALKNAASEVSDKFNTIFKRKRP